MPLGATVHLDRRGSACRRLPRSQWGDPQRDSNPIPPDLPSEAISVRLLPVEDRRQRMLGPSVPRSDLGPQLSTVIGASAPMALKGDERGRPLRAS
jgi:hypothetical protein